MRSEYRQRVISAVAVITAHGGAVRDPDVGRFGQHPARSRHGLADGVTGNQQPGQEVQQDLPLAVTAHRADDRRETNVEMGEQRGATAPGSRCHRTRFLALTRIA
jgi:hypothetical protein